MKRIGEFANDHKITVRTLRHYEQLGLIEPKRIDPTSGYRYYTDEQSNDLQAIMTLKGLGFALSEISNLIKYPVKYDQLMHKLSHKLMQARMDLEKAQTRKLGLESLMQLVQQEKHGSTYNLKEITSMNIKDIRKRIPNTDLFKDTVQDSFNKSKAQGSNLSAIVFDLDRLLHINNTYGSAAGDEVLDTLVQTIINNLPAGGIMGIEKSWLEHNGGDEFCAILEGGSCETAKAIAEAINKELSNTDFSHVGMQEKATVSAGIADLTSGAKHAQELIQFAEMAMGVAKQNRPSASVYK